jgi:DNA-binding MarR family transcriptional regulator
MSKNKMDTFTGSVDALLEHCSKLDIQEVEEQIKLDEKQDCLNVIMTDFECSLEEAEQIYSDIALSEVKQTIDQLVKEGIVEVSGYNEEGEPLFTLTELGRQIQKELGNK